MAEPITSGTDSPMIEMSVRNRQSPDNNSMNETTSSAGTSDTTGSTSSLPSADSMDSIDSISDSRSTLNSTPNGSAQVNCLQPCSIWHIALTCVSIGLLLWDAYSDYARVVNYGLDQHYRYCGLTLASALTPLWIITTIIRRRDDNNTPDNFPVWSSGHNTRSPDNGEPSTGFDPLPPPVWYRYTSTLLMWAKLAHIQRYVDILLHQLNSRQQSRSRESRQMNLNAVLHKSTEMTSLMLMVCFMGSAPQLVLQLYIEAKDMPQTISLWTEVVILSSLVTLSKSMVSYESIQMPNMNLQEYFDNSQYLFYNIVARIFALALFASLFPFDLVAFCFGHWLIMLVSIVLLRVTTFNELRSTAYLAYVLIFCYHNPSHSRRLYNMRSLYYMFVFIENCYLTYVWYGQCPDDRWYKAIAWLPHISCFFIGLNNMSSIMDIWRRDTGPPATNSPSSTSIANTV